MVSKLNDRNLPTGTNRQAGRRSSSRLIMLIESPLPSRPVHASSLSSAPVAWPFPRPGTVTRRCRATPARADPLFRGDASAPADSRKLKLITYKRSSCLRCTQIWHVLLMPRP